MKAIMIGYGPVNGKSCRQFRVSNLKLSISHDGAKVEFENALPSPTI
jgi:hypothetical protein